MKLFSERLKTARKAKQITQTQMAEILHIKQQSYTRYETGKGEPSLETFVAICKALDESPLYFLGMEDY